VAGRLEQGEDPLAGMTSAAGPWRLTGDLGSHHGPFGTEGPYFISGLPSGRGLPPVPAAAALVNR